MNLINHPQKTISVTYSNDLHPKTAALTKYNPDDSYTILLNALLSQERLEKALLHELRHIEDDHFSFDSVSKAEVAVRSHKSVKNKSNDSATIFFFQALSLSDYLKKRKIDMVRVALKGETINAKKKSDQLKKRFEKKRLKDFEKRLDDSERDYYPPGEYDEMKRQGLI